MRTMSFSSLAQAWQLVVLALTSIVLSIASGWTTWLGMQNFTGETVLSLMITFGIQGVMLVLSWIMGSRLSEHPPSGKIDPTHSAATTSGGFAERVLKIVAVSALCLLLIALFMIFSFGDATPLDWRIKLSVPTQLLLGIAALALAGIAIIRFADRIIDTTINAIKFGSRNILPILMLVGCIFTSVFFSFDALFSTILPDEERKRIADLRSKSEVAAIANQISDTTLAQRQRAAQKLLNGKAWKTYAGKLEDLSEKVRQVPEEQTRMASANQAKVRADRRSHQDSINALRQNLAVKSKARRSIEDTTAENDQQLKLIAAEIRELRARAFEIDKAIVEKTAEADAEERGIGSTSVKGRGPQYRRLRRELARLQAEKANLNLQQNRFKQQRTEIQAAANQTGVRISALDSELARLRNEIKFAEQALGERTAANAGPQLNGDVERHAAALQNVRSRFEANPTPTTLQVLQTTCNQAGQFAGRYLPAGQRPDVDHCSTTALQPVAARAFALKRGADALAQRCAGRNTQLAGATFADRLAFARNCLNWSELLPSESKAVISRINGLERERDDKAHRFVVTTNAFFDGNKLAYLALAIAGAIDMLVLASGLIGATAIRSPLTGRDFNPSQSSAQREAIISAALLPDVPLNARIALTATRPSAHAQGNLGAGWTHELDLSTFHDAQRRSNLGKLASACAAIGAATPDAERPDTFFLKPEVIEFLANLSTGAGAQDDEMSRLTRALAQAFGANVAEHSATVLSYIVPSVREPEYSSGFDMTTIQLEDEDTVRTCLNVASAFGLLTQSESSAAAITVLVKSELYFALLDLAAAMPEPRSETARSITQPEPSPQPAQEAIAPAEDTRIERQQVPHEPEPVEPSPVQPTQSRQQGSTWLSHLWRRVRPHPSPAEPPGQLSNPPPRQTKPPAPSRPAQKSPDRQIARPATQSLPAEVPAPKPRPRPRVIITNDTFDFD